MSKQKDCSICCEKYNLSTRKPVICPFGDCNFSCCKTCVRTYVLGTTADTSCMNCKKPWELNFIVSNLNRSFCDKEYKNHRKELLVEREISKLPETMHLAERQKKVNVEEEKAKTINQEIIQLNKKVNELKAERQTCYNTAYRIKRGDASESETTEKRKFIMSCPNNECKGYLSTQYKCGLCELFTCSTCFEIIGHNKTDEHTCNPDNVLSAETIRKETKPCPTCGVRIFKISGCSQMWCTECKVAFDYTTGKIDTGTIHNPHYYTHMRQQNNGVAPRNPQDIVCGGICNIYQLNMIISKLKYQMNNTNESKQVDNYIVNMHRSITHISRYDLPRIRTEVRLNADHEDLRISYILGIKNKKDFATLVYKRDNLRKKFTELLHLYEILNVVGIETFNTLYMESNKSTLGDLVKEKIIIMDNLRDYCNTEFSKVSRTYNHTVLFVNDEWIIEHKKYKKSDVKSDVK